MSIDFNFKKEAIMEILKLPVGKPHRLNSNFIRNAADHVLNQNYQCGVDCYCSECQDNKTFIISSISFFKDAKNFINSVNDSFSRSSSLPGSPEYDPSELFCKERGKFDLELYCPVCNSTVYFYYVYLNGEITKIQTYPNMMDGLKLKYRRYKELNTDVFKYDLEFITGCYLFYNSNSGIGSFCYLRRCLENLIKDYTNDLFSTGEIESGYDQFKKFEEKITIIKNELDPSIFDLLKPLYSILSLGIHELDEGECLNDFEALKDIVEVLLDERIEKINKKKKIEKMKKDLNAKASALSKK